MRVTESLQQIRSKWLSKVSRRLAKGEGIREGIRQQLDYFYDSILDSVETGDPTRLNSVLDDWIRARTESEIKDRRSSLSPILQIILSETFDLVHESFGSDVGIRIIGKILPLFVHALEYATRRETEFYVTHVSEELEKVQLSLERLDRSKSDFIAIAAHELKTPLTLIEGYVTMLRENMGSGDENSQPVLLLKGVDQGTSRLREIVDDMIDVSMIDNSLLALNFQPIWLHQLFKILRLEFSKTVEERRQNLEFFSFTGSTEMIFGDAERLYQAFRNLISNAVKFTPDGGSIKIDGRLLPGFIEIKVTDTGIGIDPEDHNRIFEKFGRLGSVSLHSSGKTKFKGGGPGLGLPITKGIIEAHGGAIWVESDACDEKTCPGTTFHVLLPLRKEPPDEKNAELFQPLMDIYQKNEDVPSGNTAGDIV